MKPIVFNARILQNEGRSGGCYVEFPFNTEELFGSKGRVPVVCRFDGVEYRGSLVKMGGSCHIVGVLKEVMAKIGKKPGDIVEVSIIKDESERVIIPDPLLAPFLEANELLKAAYEKLSYTNKKEINQSLERAKREETKQARLKKILDGLGNS